MAKGHSTGKSPVKIASGEKVHKQLSIGQKQALAIIKTTADLGQLMEQRNIPQIDFDEQLSDILAEDLEELEDIVEGENPDNDDLREEYDDEEDDYKDYDEMGPNDPFEIEERDTSHKPIYVVTASFEKGDAIIEFQQVPQYDTNNVLVKNALLERNMLLHKMAFFIAQAQTSFFKTNDEKHLGNLNQQDIVEALKKQGKNLSKEHVSRMLDALYFKIEGLGTVPAKFLFKRYGTKSRLNQEDKLADACEFLKICDVNLNQLEKAKALVQFIEQKRGITIGLSGSKNEHDKYKQWKNIIRQVEAERK